MDADKTMLHRKDGAPLLSKEEEDVALPPRPRCAFVIIRNSKDAMMVCTALTLVCFLVFRHAVGSVLPHSDPGKNGSPHPRGELRFTENGTFQIAIFEDLHFGESRSLSGHHINDSDWVADYYAQTLGSLGARYRTSTLSKS